MAEIEKDLTISFLFDFYGEMLTDIQKRAIEYYYNQDLSLAEIANHSGITRQGVRDAIKRGERQLINYEEKLGLYQRFHQIQDSIDVISNSAEIIEVENTKTGNSPIIKRETDVIVSEINKLNY